MKLYVCCLISFVALGGTLVGGFDINSDNITNIAFADVVEEKFDPFFYDKVKGLIGGDISGASTDDDGLYNVVMVVNGENDDEIQENKDALVELLEDIGAKNIKPAVVLAFVTADIPIQEIPDITGLAQIMQIGDGELPIQVVVDKAKETIKATSQYIRQIHNTDLTGDGVRVGVIDGGINSIFLNDKVVKRSYCTGDECNIENGYFTGTLAHGVGSLNSTTATHGTEIAQIIAASGMTKHNGIAPGVDLLDIMIGYTVGTGTRVTPVMSDLHALDWAITNNVDVVNRSIAYLYGCSTRASTIDIIHERAVVRGLIISQAAGNYGNNSYQSIVSPACARNVISVGGIDDRVQVDTMYDNSSRGPTFGALPILKPEIVAPAMHVYTLESTTQELFEIFVFVGGTSLATPMVAGVSALMLEADPTLTPNEVKNLLLLGANWTGPIPCTSSQYEQNNPNDNCSFARQPNDNSRNDINILNNVGFGILDAQKSINYTLNSDTYMISSYLQHGTIPARNYTITIPDTNQPVKVILNWLVKPLATNSLNPVPANINFDVICGDKTYTARSAHQTNEFVVFNPDSVGQCTVAVIGAFLNPFGMTTHHFTVSSNVPISIDTTSRNNVNGVGSQALFDITTRSVGKASIDTTGKYTYSPVNTLQKGHIYIPPSTTISNDLFVAGDVGKTCIRSIIISSEFKPLADPTRFALPNDVSSGISHGFGYSNYGDDSTNPKNCTLRNTAIATTSTTLETDKILQVVLYDQSGKEGYSYLRAANINTAQDIPECNSANFNKITKTLKGITKMCYADVSNDLVIYTKILQWYGAKDKTVEPTKPDPLTPVTPIPPVTNPVPDSDIISITLPESIGLDTSSTTLDLNTYGNNKIRIDTYSIDVGTRYYINNQADITIFRNTEITNKEFTYNSDNYCYSGDLRVGTIPGITLPITNISNALYLQFREHSPDRCDQAPNIDLTGNLDLDTNVYVRFSNTAGLNPFYSNGTSISPIPKCDITNFEDTTNTLKNINACYGKNNNDMIIVSKVLSIFGVTAQDITIQPDQTIDTNSDIISITVPESIEFDTSQNTIDLNTYATNKIRIDTYYSDIGTRYFINDKSDITIFRDTEIIDKEFTYQPDKYCYVSNLLAGQDSTISIQHTNTLQLPFERSSISDRCDQAPAINLDGKLNLDTNVYVRFVNSIDQTPFYHYDNSTIQIPKCSSMNFDSTTNTLKNIEICYGKSDNDINDIIIVSKILAVFGITVQDIPEPKQPDRSKPLVVEPIPDPDQIPDPVTVDPTLQQNAFNYQDYNNKITNSTLNVEKDAKTLYLAMPKCEKTHDRLSRSDRVITMTYDKDIVFTFTTDKDFTNGESLIIIRDDTGVFKQISLTPTRDENNYTVTIPNDILDNSSDHLSIHAYFYKPSSTIHVEKIYSTDPSGSPLFYHNKNGTSPIVIRLPDAVNRTFEIGTIKNLDGNAYIPQHKSKNKSITLSQDTLCQVGIEIPHQIAKVFDLGINATSTTDGLEFTYKFGNNKYVYPSGGSAREQAPNVLNYIIIDSEGNEITGKTDDKIKKKKPFSFTVPITSPGDYDILIYGQDNRGRILGTFSDSITFDPAPETPVIPITIPESWKLDITDMTIDLYTYTNNVRIDTYHPDKGTIYHITDKSSTITMFRDTHIIKQYTPTKIDNYCYVGDLLVGKDSTISKSHITTLQISFRNADDPTRCDESPDIDLTGKLVLDKEIFVRFANTDNVPFYYDGTVHSIPKCTTDNYDDDTSTLKSGEICYGVYGNDTVIVSKILTMFGI